MRQIVMLTAVVAALAGAGMAVAHHSESKSVKKVDAAFTAAPSGTVKVSSCTGTDGTYVTTKATYAGTATSTTDPNLNGPITLRTESLINTTTNVGTVSGRLNIDAGSGRDTNAEFALVYSGGNVAGLAAGHTEDHSALLGNVSAAFNSTTGFTAGKIGGTTGGDAVVTAR